MSLDAPFLWTGARALVKHAYHTAAEVTAYQLAIDRKSRRATLGGTVAESDPYLLTQTPLVFVVTTKGGVYRWPVESVQITGTQLVARLGALEGF